MIRMTSAFLMSTQPFVIAPRPNVAAKLATVGPCQTLACVSRYGTPKAEIAFHLHHLRGDVLRLVAERVDDHATGDRAVGTGAASLGGARDLELPHFRARFRCVEADAHRCATERRALQKSPPLHGASRLSAGRTLTRFPQCCQAPGRIG